MLRFTRMRSTAAPAVRGAVNERAVQVKQDGFGVGEHGCLTVLCGGKHVVDAGVVAQPIVFGQGLYSKLRVRLTSKSAARRGGQLSGLDELGVGVGTLGQHVQYVFGAHNGEQNDFGCD